MTDHKPIHRRWFVFAIAAAVTIGLAPTPVAAAERYQYLMVPGTSAWSELPNHRAMERVTQLPDMQLKQMSTRQLADAVLDYPLFMDIIAYDSVQQGLEIVTSRFNGLRELFKRSDAGAVLLRDYERFDVRVSGSGSELVAGDRSWRAWRYEILLAQPQVFKTLAANDLKRLLRVGREKFTAKLADAHVYGQAGLDHTAVLLGRVLATVEGWDWKRSRLLREAFAPVANAAEIAGAVDRYFAEPSLIHAIDDGVGAQDHNGTVYTPNGSAVPVIVTTYELTAAQITSVNRTAAKQYPQATRLANASRRYNCHSYAWYWASSSNTYWMNTPGDDTYWSDGSYTRWFPPLIVFPNMQWSWVYGDHSGIEDGTSSYIRSKWGQWPLMYHYWNYSPYNDSDVDSYYRR